MIRFLKNKEDIKIVKSKLRKSLGVCDKSFRQSLIKNALEKISTIKKRDKTEWQTTQKEFVKQRGKDLITVKKIKERKKQNLKLLRRKFLENKDQINVSNKFGKDAYKDLKQKYNTDRKEITQLFNNKIHHIFPNWFTQLITLTKLNLSDSDSSEKALRHLSFRYIILFFFGLIVGSYLAYSFFSLFRGTTGLNISPNKPFIEVVISLFLLISIISSSLLLSKKLFEDKRNNIIETFPAKPNIVYYSKLLASYLLELKKSVLVYASLFGGYAFTFTQLISFRYFSLVFVLLLVIPFVTICVGQLLSFLIHIVKRILNKNLISYGLIGIGCFLLTISIINTIINHFGQGQNEITKFNVLLSLHDLFNFKFYSILKVSLFTKVIRDILFFTNNNTAYLVLFGIIGFANILCFISPLLYLLIKKINFSIFDTSINFKLKDRYFNKTPLYFTQLAKEVKETTRDLKQVVSIMIYTFLMPLIFYFLNSFFKFLTLSPEGKLFVIVGELMMGLLILTSGNFLSSTIISREEHNLYFLKSNPRNILGIIAAKLTIPLAINFMVILINFILNEKTSIILTAQNLSMHILFALGVILHTVWVSEIDIVTPDEQSYKDSDNIQDNKNIFKSILVGIIITSLIISFSIIFMNSTNARIPVLPLALTLLGFIIYRLINLFIKASVYLRWNA